MTPIIEAKGLTKRFGTVDALAGLDLVAESGQVTALLGPNGAGKTTFVSAVATLLRPDAGELRVDGIDVASEPERVRRIIGLAGQYASVEPAMTGRENLEFVARLFGLDRRRSRSAAAAVLDRMDLAEADDRLVRTYSGGMRRRLDLGASLVGRPRLLLLDEPTTGLDPRSRKDLWEAVRNLVADGVDVLLTTQYLEEADQLARQVVIVDHGRVIEAGTPDELKDRAGRHVIEVRPRAAGDLPAIEEILGTVAAETPSLRHRYATRDCPDRGRRRAPRDRRPPARRTQHPARRHRLAPAVARRGLPRPHRTSVRRRPTLTVNPRPREGPDLIPGGTDDRHHHINRHGRVGDRRGCAPRAGSGCRFPHRDRPDGPTYRSAIPTHAATPRVAHDHRRALSVHLPVCLRGSNQHSQRSTTSTSSSPASS